jgi:transcriptional regulator with XRE-family HTH domain
MNLSAIRRFAGLTQAQLAERMDTDQPFVSRLERQKDWKLSTVVAFLIGTGVDAHLVLRRDGEELDLRLSRVTRSFKDSLRVVKN